MAEREGDSSDADVVRDSVPDAVADFVLDLVNECDLEWEYDAGDAVRDSVTLLLACRVSDGECVADSDRETKWECVVDRDVYRDGVGVAVGVGDGVGDPDDDGEPSIPLAVATRASSTTQAATRRMRV